MARVIERPRHRRKRLPAEKRLPIAERTRIAIEEFGLPLEEVRAALARMGQTLKRAEFNPGMFQKDKLRKGVEKFADDIARLQKSHKKLPLVLQELTASLLEAAARWEKTCREFLKVKPAAPRSDSDAEVLAAIVAARLLHTQGRKIVTTVGGEWCQLAAVVYGDRKFNMHHAVRAVKRCMIMEPEERLRHEIAKAKARGVEVRKIAS